jgi:hypothetical protein
MTDTRKERARRLIKIEPAPVAPVAEAVTPTVALATMATADSRLPLAEAEEKVASIINSFFDETVPAYAARLRAFELEANAPRRTKLPPRAQAWIVRVEMGIGKTHTAILTIAKHVRRHRQVVYAAPEHQVLEEIAAKYRAQGINVAVYHGAKQKDPRDPAKDMCLNPKARAAAESLGISVRRAVCASPAGTCPFADKCGVEWQRTRNPQMWIIPSSLLMIHRPDFILQPDAVVVDEQFHEASIEEPQVIDVESLLTTPTSDTLRYDERTALVTGREALHAAVRANGSGPLSRSALLDHGISMKQAGWFSSLEIRALDATVIWPGMPDDEMAEVAKEHKDVFATARALSSLWDEIADFLCEGDYDDVPEWARIKVTGAEKITLRSLRSVHASWRAPMLLLDATAPSVEVLYPSVAGGGFVDVVEKADITARWSDHVHVRQIFGAPVTMGKIGLYGEDKPENVRDILRYIRMRAAMAYPADIGLITYKGLLEKLQGKLPKNVTVTAHFGALAGLNSMERVAGLIVIGRPYIKPAAAEAKAEVFGGRPVVAMGKYYGRRPVVVQLATGAEHRGHIDYHAHAMAETHRSQGTERGLLQAVGRLRPHRRSAPCFLDIVSDVLLPVPVHESASWGDVAPGAVGDMSDEGIILSNRRDVAVAFPDLSERQGRGNGVGETGYDSLLSNNKGIVPSFSVRKFRYRVVGSRGPKSTGYYLPAIIGGPAALRDWLVARLGAPITLTIEPVRSRNSRAAQAMFAKAGRSMWTPPPMPVLAALRAVAAWIEADAAGATDE